VESMARGLLLSTLAVGVGLAASAHAQPETPRAPEDDGCEPASTVEFSIGTARLDLGAESDLASAANWAWAEPGRFLMVVGPTGPLPGDAQLGYVRTIEATAYLAGLGVHPRLIAVGTFDEQLTESDRRVTSSHTRRRPRPWRCARSSCLGPRRRWAG